MATEHALKHQYEYKSNANLVLQADRSLIDPRPKDESKGEVQSLVPHLKKYRMGDKYQRSQPKKPQSKTIQKSTQDPSYISGLLDDGANIIYKPKTNETRSAYESILCFIQSSIGEQPRDILMGAADEVLAVLKDEQKKDKDKKSEIFSLLGHLDEENYSILINLGKKITDYYSEHDLKDLDEAVGVTVQYDEGSETGESEVSEKSSEIDSEPELNREIKTNLAKDDENTTDLINPWEIDAYWLQRQLNKYYNEAEFSHKKAREVIEILKNSTDERDCENKLVFSLGFDKFAFIKTLRINRQTVLYCSLLASAQTQEEKDVIESEMSSKPELLLILNQFHQRAALTKKQTTVSELQPADVKNKSGDIHTVDLDSLAFREGSHVNFNKKCVLVDGSYRKQHKGYEEVFVPSPPKNAEIEEVSLIFINSLPEFAKKAFTGYQTLNRVQSAVADKALKTDDNLLICAPTGSGKTNVAVLCILREISKCLLDENGKKIDLEAFKVIYVAPMKSLVQEMVQNFSKRFQDYGITVAEMTGDHQLNREQAEKTQILVCTPEKWDIVTRKAGENVYTQLVKLVIFDEIHMLHDTRGPVIESLVARMHRQCDETLDKIRIVGLSATLPNYQAVAAFIRVDLDTGCFYFDASFRPVPLEQHFIGITERKPLKMIKIMNDIVYEKLIENAGRCQVLVFVHSRKETVKTAKIIRDMCLEKETLGMFVREGTASAEILKSESDQSKNPDLKDLLPFGFGMHHAGMNKIDRKLIEDLFADGHIQVLFSTATLAWGVNLPAHTVIIKGTQVYDPEKGKWVELGAIDVLQMLGRAGRPQYDTKGQGILITSHLELQYYLSLMNQQLPIESHFISKLSENLNAEVALGTISNISEGAEWLTYTYLFVRMLKSPSIYGSSIEELESDNVLYDRRKTLIHSAALGLDKSGLIKYDVVSGTLISTDLGRIASHFYCTQETINTYNRLLRPSMTQIELFRTVSLSSEFKNITVRAEEKIELQQLLEKVPIPVKETVEDPAAKINVLLQAYISQLRLDGFVLMSDMVYVTQSANRLVRAIFEICYSRGWADMTEKALCLSKMIDNRMWGSMSPLRQFKMIPPEIIRKIEKKDFQWERFYDLEPHEVGELIHAPKMGKVLHKFIHHFPKLELSAHAQPITRSLLRIEMTIIPDFKWDSTIHGNAEAFWIFVTDSDCEKILHSEYFILNHRFVEDEHYLKFFVPLFDPLPPHYYIKVISDKWVRAETIMPISLMRLILPEKNPMSTELLDLQPLPISALKNESFEQFYSEKFSYFNPVQTQIFNCLYNSRDSTLVAAPPGSGKSLCIELAIMSFLKNGTGKCVCLIPVHSAAEAAYQRFKLLFEKFEGINVGYLTGESASDLKIMNQSLIVVSNPENWDMFSRRWKQRKVIQSINTFIVDDLHMVGGINGPCLEIVCSRIRYISSQLENPIRIVALSMSLTNAKDIAQWLGISPNNTYNFHPSVRPLPLNLQVQGWSMNNPITRMTAMMRSVHSTLSLLVDNQNVIIFVENRKQAKLIAMDLSVTVDRFLTLKCSGAIVEEYHQVWKDTDILSTLGGGVGYLHEGMSKMEAQELCALFADGGFQVLVVTRPMAWTLRVMSYMVIVLDTQYYDGRFHSNVDYPISDVLKMCGRSGRFGVDHSGVVKIFCLSSKKDQYLKFLKDSYPVESHLDHYLHDHFCAEIVTKVIENKQDAVDYLTWTLLYRRLIQNPNYYNMQGITHRHLSDYLSELVENTLNDLSVSKCITVEDEMNVFPLNSSMIASYYYINYSTIELFNASLNEGTKLRALIEIISSSQEFEQVSVRLNEEVYLMGIVSKVTYKPKDGKFTDSHNKANLLIQAYLSRISLPVELQADCDCVIRKCHKLAQACVDVLSSNGWLNPAIVAMEFAQMITQATWSRDSPLKQIPFFTNEVVERCKNSKIESVFDLLDMDDEPRRRLLEMSDAQLMKVAEFCNSYPSINVKYSVCEESGIFAGESVQVVVEVEREDEQSKSVIAPFFPYPRDEAIWVVIGNVKTNALYSIKRVSLQKSSTIRLEFTASEEVGIHNYTLYVISDSYLGSDQEFPIDINVQASTRKRKSELEEVDEEDKKAKI